MRLTFIKHQIQVFFETVIQIQIKMHTSARQEQWCSNFCMSSPITIITLICTDYRFINGFQKWVDGKF